MVMLRRVGLTACSNGLTPDQSLLIHDLAQTLCLHEVEPVYGNYLYSKDGTFSGTGAQRAGDVMTFFEDETVDAILDISGGDLANDVLDELDYDKIARSRQEFWGYSDLTTVLNAIYTKTGKTSVLYSPKNLVLSHRQEQQDRFFAGDDALFALPYRFLRGQQLEGTLVGGNIRCLLKLAGTPYFPPMDGKILLLEACGGTVPLMTAFLNQLRQMGVFNKIAGILLGTFTKMEADGATPTMEELVLHYAPEHLPVVKTDKIGHAPDAMAARIGAHYRFDCDKDTL